MARKSASASSRVLTDHEEIRRWAEERNATPARVKGTGGDCDVGIIRLDFPGYSGEDTLEEISWDEWFRKFDESNLALLVQDRTARGQKSNFNKLISRETAEQWETDRSSSSRSQDRGSERGRTGAEEDLEAYSDTDLYQEADTADEDLEEDLEAEESRPIRISGDSTSRGRKPQSRTAGRGREATRAARNPATARSRDSQSRGGLSPKKAAARTSSKRTPASGGKHAGAGKKAPGARSAGTQARSSRRRTSASRKRAA